MVLMPDLLDLKTLKLQRHYQYILSFLELIDCLVLRFLEGDFDTYVGQMRKPHIWGGEPELLMCSHVLQ